MRKTGICIRVIIIFIRHTHFTKYYDGLVNRVRWAGQVECIVMTNAHRILLVNRESGARLGRPTRIGEANIRLDVKQIGCEGVEWTKTGSG
jgi:hypothetical protein